MFNGQLIFYIVLLMILVEFSFVSNGLNTTYDLSMRLFFWLFLSDIQIITFTWHTVKYY